MGNQEETQVRDYQEDASPLIIVFATAIRSALVGRSDINPPVIGRTQADHVGAGVVALVPGVYL